MTSILFLSCFPHHHAFSVSFVISPFTFIEISWCVYHCAFTILHAILPFSLIISTVFVLQCSVTMSQSIFPLTLILNSFFRIYVFSLAFSHSILNIANIGWFVCPCILSSSSDFIHCKFSFVLCSIFPNKLTFSMKKSVPHSSSVNMTFFELTSSSAIIDLCTLGSFFKVDNFTGPFWDYKLRKLDRKIGNLW